MEHAALSGCGGVGGQIRAVSHIKPPRKARGVQRSHVGTEQSGKLACERGRAVEK